MKKMLFFLLFLPWLGVAETNVGKVFKSPTCGCCNAWISHMKEAGFNLVGQNQQDMNQIKQQFGILPIAQSCHTAEIEHFVFEGHVPAEVVKRFLAAPVIDALGLSVPGMPVGSPGMEVGHRHDDYTVQVLLKDGTMSPYAKVSRDSIHYLD